MGLWAVLDLPVTLHPLPAAHTEVTRRLGLTRDSWRMSGQGPTDHPRLMRRVGSTRGPWLMRRRELIRGRGPTGDPWPRRDLLVTWGSLAINGSRATRHPFRIQDSTGTVAIWATKHH